MGQLHGPQMDRLKLVRLKCEEQQRESYKNSNVEGEHAASGTPLRLHNCGDKCIRSNISFAVLVDM